MSKFELPESLDVRNETEIATNGDIDHYQDYDCPMNPPLNEISAAIE